MFKLKQILFVFFHFRLSTKNSHLQQGGNPSPFDRNLGTKMAAKAADWMIQQLVSQKEKGTVASTPDSCVLLGLQRRQYRFTPVQQLKSGTDFK